jgi:transposase
MAHRRRPTRRHSLEFKLQVIAAYQAGEGTIHALAAQYDIHRTLLEHWLGQAERGELTGVSAAEHEAQDARAAQARIAALERKVGQLTMELEALKKGVLVSVSSAAARGGRPLIVAGPAASRPPKGAAR